MTAPDCPPTGIPRWLGLAMLLGAQCLVATVSLAIRQPAGVPAAARTKTVAAVSVIVLTAAAGGWWFSQAARRLAATRPALAVAGGLAVVLLRLTVPLMLLGWLQTAAAAARLSPPLRDFMAETLVASYLVLLLVDILLHVAAGFRHRVTAVAPEDR